MTVTDMVRSHRLHTMMFSHYILWNCAVVSSLFQTSLDDV